MATIRIVLDTRRIKKDGTYPLVIRVTLNAKFKDYPTRCQVTQKDWDIKSCSVRKSHPHNSLINIRLKELEYEFTGKLMDCFRAHQEGFSFEELRSYLEPKIVKISSVKEFWDKEIQGLIIARKFGNARNYRMVLSVLEKACNLDVSFQQVDYSYLKELENNLLSRGLKTNSVSVYLRAFRAIYNMAINKNIVGYDCYPFRAYRISKEKTVPVYSGQADPPTGILTPLGENAIS